MANPTGKNQYSRGQGHRDLSSAITKGVKGVNASSTIGGYRSLAARAIKNNRTQFKTMGLPKALRMEMTYKTAIAAVKVRKEQWAKVSKKFAPQHR